MRRASPPHAMLSQLGFIMLLSGMIGFVAKGGRRVATFITLLGVSVATVEYAESVRMFPVIFGFRF